MNLFYKTRVLGLGFLSLVSSLGQDISIFGLQASADRRSPKQRDQSAVYYDITIIVQ